MMFNSINNDINNYNSISYKRQYAKQPLNNSHLLYRQSMQSGQNLGYKSSNYVQNRQSPYSKAKKSTPINENNFYKQNYEVNSPFEENLRHSDVRSYTSEQYYPSSQSDKLSQNSNKWSRNTASYFPTSPLFNHQQFSSSQYQQSPNKMFTQSSNPFKKHSQKRPQYNFDSFSNRSKSRIKQMNQKIDLTTKSILKNGLVHQKQIFTSSIARSSSKQQGSRQKRQFQSPRNLQQRQSRISSDRKNHSSIDRKKQYLFNRNQNDFQRQVFAQSKINTLPNDFPISKSSFSQSNNYERIKPDRMPPYFQQTPVTINSPFESNKRMSHQQIFNKQDETINFLQHQDNNNRPQLRQNAYRLPSTHRKDITFNLINKDHMMSKQLTQKDDFSSMRGNNLKFDKPILYTSQSQQTFNKSKNSYPSSQQFLTNKPIIPQFQLKPYPNNRVQKQRLSDLKISTQFQPTDLIVLNRNRSSQKLQQKMLQKNHFNFQSNNSQKINFIPTLNKQDNYSDYKQMNPNFVNSQSSRFSDKNMKIENLQPFKRTSSFQKGFDFFDFKDGDQNEDRAFININHKISGKEQNYYGGKKDEDFEFEDFQDQNQKYRNFQTQEQNVGDEKFSQKFFDQSPLQNIQKRRQVIKQRIQKQISPLTNKSEDKQEQFPTVRTILAPKVNLLQNYMSQIKDKQSQVIALSLIVLAVFILIIQLAS